MRRFGSTGSSRGLAAVGSAREQALGTVCATRRRGESDPLPGTPRSFGIRPGDRLHPQSSVVGALYVSTVTGTT